MAKFKISMSHVLKAIPIAWAAGKEIVKYWSGRGEGKVCATCEHFSVRTPGVIFLSDSCHSIEFHKHVEVDSVDGTETIRVRRNFCCKFWRKK